MIIWCWADHAWPGNRFAGYSVSPYGVLSRSRKILEPYHAAKEMFTKKWQQDTERFPRSYRSAVAGKRFPICLLKIGSNLDAVESDSSAHRATWRFAVRTIRDDQFRLILFHAKHIANETHIGHF